MTGLWLGELEFCCCLVAKSCPPVSLSLVTPWTVAHWAPLLMGFPRLEY